VTVCAYTLFRFQCRYVFVFANLHQFSVQLMTVAANAKMAESVKAQCASVLLDSKGITARNQVMQYCVNYVVLPQSEY
jgi:hypothetical protein